MFDGLIFIEISERKRLPMLHYLRIYNVLIHICVLPWAALAGWWLATWPGGRVILYCRVGDCPQWDYTDARFTGALYGGRLCTVCIPRYCGKGSGEAQGKNWAQVARHVGLEGLSWPLLVHTMLT